MRACIPRGDPGVYLLFRRGQRIYVGRSDTDLRIRLSQHVGGGATEFAAIVCPSPWSAYRLERAAYLSLRPPWNRVLPRRPPGS
ncbi:hypothetical protein CA12_18300 [Alienimonas californiensis]|uniref:GIY-YIG domain-containing protein n=1 Tax=Alienimonas californiensis TaxID=2527989 RepID=A0A517P8N6_9PLAN|nr:hypothetical protein CA12_18300 [Alienimonas californiensis]